MGNGPKCLPLEAMNGRPLLRQYAFWSVGATFKGYQKASGPTPFGLLATY